MTQVCNQFPKSPKVAAKRSAAVDSLLNPEFFRALSDPTRLQLLCCLAKCGRSCSLSEVADCCHIDLSVVSRHMTILRNAGIVRARKEGRTVLYTTNYQQLGALFRNIAHAIEQCCPTGASGSDCGC